MSKLRDAMKAAIRKQVDAALPKQVDNNVMGVVQNVNSDGTAQVQTADGNTYQVNPIYPIALGQNVMVININDDKNIPNCIPVVPKTPPSPPIIPPYFSGGVGKTLFIGNYGGPTFGFTNLGPNLDGMEDLLVQIPGQDAVIAFRSRDILDATDYANAITASNATNNSDAIYTLTPDNTKLIILYPGWIVPPLGGHVLPPNVIVTIDLTGAGALAPGTLINSTYNIYTPQTLKIINYVSGLTWPSPGMLGNMWYVLSIYANNGGEIWIEYNDGTPTPSPIDPTASANNIHLARIDVGSHFVQNLATINVFSVLIPYFVPPFDAGQAFFGGFLNPLNENGIFLTYIYTQIIGGSTVVYDAIVAIGASGFTSPPNSDLVTISDSGTYADFPADQPNRQVRNMPLTYAANISTFWGFGGSQLFRLWAYDMHYNSQYFWHELLKVAGNNVISGTQAINIQSAALLSQEVAGGPIIYTQFDSSIQVVPPGLGNNSNNTSQQNVIPKQLSLHNDTVYAIDYSDSDQSGHTFWYPKLYKLVGGLGGTLTITGGSLALKNISPGYDDPDAIRLFSKSVNGLGLYSALSTFIMFLIFDKNGNPI